MENHNLVSVARSHRDRTARTTTPPVRLAHQRAVQTSGTIAPGRGLGNPSAALLITQVLGTAHRPANVRRGISSLRVEPRPPCGTVTTLLTAPAMVCMVEVPECTALGHARGYAHPTVTESASGALSVMKLRRTVFIGLSAVVLIIGWAGPAFAADGNGGAGGTGHANCPDGGVRVGHSVTQCRGHAGANGRAGSSGSSRGRGGRDGTATVSCPSGTIKIGNGRTVQCRPTQGSSGDSGWPW